MSASDVPWTEITPEPHNGLHKRKFIGKFLVRLWNWDGVFNTSMLYNVDVVVGHEESDKASYAYNEDFTDWEEAQRVYDNIEPKLFLYLAKEG